MFELRRGVLAACLAALVLGLAAQIAPADTDAARAEALTNEARTLYRDCRLSEAAGKLETALEQQPGYTPAHQLLAVVYQSQGAPEKALDHYWAVQRASLPALPDDASAAEARTRELLVECEGLLTLLMNQERQKRGLRLCLPDPKLVAIARQHSEEMRDLRYFAHESPTEGYQTITQRFLRVFSGLRSYSIAENIARRYATGMYSLSPENAETTHTDWMNSSGHRANILREELDHVGVGMSVNANGDYWATQFFARY